MILYPAIDIYQGQCVRLTQGDFKRSKVYFKNPVDAAKQWADEGAEWLHLVDLDGALHGQPKNQKVIEQIRNTVSIALQAGGGIRTEETVLSFLKMGLERVVLGSAVIEDFPSCEMLAKKYRSQIVFGLDAREGKVTIRGWKEETAFPVLTIVRKLENLQPACFICTDVKCDGMMGGPNIESLSQLVQLTKIPIVASGGISSLDDLKKLKEIGCDGAILGRSIYEGKVYLKEALKLC
ncbi:MAG: 1-(5-phosphoribosyl)-5-[(5-phosphoribosylamino)methylideneamino]imidazole-4-carboxamide isomerase [Deltaproteobacteria bacterium]|nr:1-(5-phosphoribosyl)-5-[(5-phosphoribosylamino)methylideneamino]imidazole-4-carboxamide isomerase [Deltaproteobacteria bacterium]MBI2500328.1 1-(5-phosphoribosyl)-5-[(5-phosphoribosylamino)methylideneamino]imidazole-4-carboxamide isomerase [Deltaproteobacteria bacterium]MBI4197105.1 1-(5-phosphoribosyl)-5-[(5-phosphoribosylamino)methylideneamino]imidazole-4-carboxamide isomerase [Deltaproteobacteria bacterium]